MAVDLFTFGVKYRLDVSDVEGCLWRIDIEEKDYVGSVTNFIGDGTAFEITWENNEDYDKSIIGSLARISIMAKPVADAGSPSFTDLFTTDENKFRVKIFYDETFAPLKDNFSPYWQGFIVQDDYVEQVIADPYRVQIVATENFGKLKRFPFNDNDPSRHEEFYTPLETLYTSLNKIGLAMDGYDFSGMHIEGVTAAERTTPFVEQVAICSEAFLKGDVYNDYYSYFEVLESKIKGMDCFLVQAYGKLYIMPNAAYDSVLNANFGWDAFDLNFGASSFTTNRSVTVETPRLLDIPVDFKVLDKSLVKTRKGAAQLSVNEYNFRLKNLFYNGSFELDGDFGVEANGQVPAWFSSFDAGLGGSGHIDQVVGYSNVSSHDYSSGSGARSLRGNIKAESVFDAFNAANETDRNQDYTEYWVSSDFTQNSLGTTINPYIKGLPYEQDHSSSQDYELQADLSFKIFIPENNIASSIIPCKFTFSLEWDRGVTYPEKYFNFGEGGWQAAHTFGTEVVESTGEWVEVKRTIPVPVNHVSSALPFIEAIKDAAVKLRFHVAYPDNENTGAYYLDDVSLIISQPEGAEDAITTGTNVFSAEIEETDETLGSEARTNNVLGGITNFNYSGFSGSLLFERTDLLTRAVDSQYFKDGANQVLDPKWFYDKNPVSTTPDYIPRVQPLQEWVNEHRWDETKVTQSLIQGNLKNVTNVNGGVYKPITPLDVLSMSFRSGAYDTNKYGIVRLSINPRLNLINFVAKNIVETQGSYVNP